MERDTFEVGDVVTKKLQPGTTGRVLEIYNHLVRVSFPMSSGWYEKTDLQLKTTLDIEFELDQ